MTQPPLLAVMQGGECAHSNLFTPSMTAHAPWHHTRCVTFSPPPTAHSLELPLGAILSLTQNEGGGKFHLKTQAELEQQRQLAKISDKFWKSLAAQLGRAC